MEKVNKEEQFSLSTPQNQTVFYDYVKAGNSLSKANQLLMFEHPQADDLVISYVGNGHILSEEAMLKVFNLNPTYAQLIMELCVAYDFPLSKEVQLKLFELKYPKAVIRRYIRQNQDLISVDGEMYQKAKDLRYI